MANYLLGGKCGICDELAETMSFPNHQTLVLPCDLRSAQKIFTATAEWVVKQQSIKFLMLLLLIQLIWISHGFLSL